MNMGRNAHRMADWESLGRQVRLMTFDAIALHFAEKAYESGQSGAATDRKDSINRIGIHHE